MTPIKEGEYLVFRTYEEVEEYAKTTNRNWISGSPFLGTKSDVGELPIVLYIFWEGYVMASVRTMDIPKPFTIEKAIAYVESKGRVPQVAEFNIEKFNKL